MIKEVRVELTDYLGIKKTVRLKSGQIKHLNRTYTIRDALGRLKSVCRGYSNNYWVTGYVNNHKVCWYQWAQL